MTDAENADALPRVIEVPARDLELWDWIGEGRVVFLITWDALERVVAKVGTPQVRAEVGPEIVQWIDWTNVDELMFDGDASVKVVRGGGPTGRLAR